LDHQVLQIDKDEQIRVTVSRSKVGLIPIVTVATATLLASLVFILVIGFYRESVGDVVPVSVAISLLLIVTLLIEIFSYIGYVVYIRNQLTVTDDSIIQHLQRGLFHKHISQLNIGNIEDVTVNQSGILAHMFDYGTITIETAGEQSNFTFPYAKDPYNAAKVIIECHERFLKIRPESAQNA
jgi:hypothetical protein